MGECREMLATQNVVLVFCDQDFVDGTFRDVLAASHSSSRQPSVVLTGQLRNSDQYHAALDFGAFVTSPRHHSTDVEWMVIRAAQMSGKDFPKIEDGQLRGEETITA